MNWLSNSTVARLRDQLRTRGQRPSLVLPPGATPEIMETVTLVAEYGPLCEAMYLMMSADGEVSQAEREVLKGALRNLSGDTLRSTHIEGMLDEASRKVGEHGRTQRLSDVAGSLKEDSARAEVALILAAAIAFADNAIADEENDLLGNFASELGISESRANELLDGVEADLAEKGTG